jgi:hypothetical protein
MCLFGEKRILLSNTLNSCKRNYAQMADNHNQIFTIVCQAINIHEKKQEDKITK